ncbi:multiple monosaccharide ABC transporter permease [Lapillicoccus jejuensis]|uniref:Xylose transport system permease protein XylH n=1 Tax=Lapillicoccus jejuensis TaxID=402171 RepID=A0A542E3Q0_9MICO|nr:multiple monosaccharide ABC transporter permease [Lapillicoccus jejuensis]TQJ09906.1 putative multiple sugar transport system permease protein [Lapillicoccus jejuensis]
MNKVRQIFGGDLRQLGMVVALVAILVFFHIWTGGFVISPDNFNNIIQGNAYILVLAIGMVLVIIAGNIDLSVGSVSAAVGISVALAMQNWNLPWPLAILFGLALGALIGAWQGLWTAYVGIPAFIVTLAGMLTFRGVNQAIGKSLTVQVPDGFQVIGQGVLPEVGPNTGYNNLTILVGIVACLFVVYGTINGRRKLQRIGAEVEDSTVTWTRLVLICVVILGVMFFFASGRQGFPVSGLILVALILIYSFIAQRTITGRHVYAVGGNRLAAELSGVKSKRINFLVMMNMSVLAALAGMMFDARSAASGPFDGQGWELDAIAAVFIGGAAVSGGVGTVIGSMVGGLVMASLNNGLQIKGIGADATQIIKGLVLLLAVALDVYNKSQGKPSVTALLMRNSRGTRGGSGGPTAASATPQDTSQNVTSSVGQSR